jgi:ABC-2 type transport system permease protein
MYFRIFRNQLLLGLKLYGRIPSAMFWVFAFPIVMLLGMGTVFSGRASEGLKLVWERAPEAGPADDELPGQLAEHGLTLEALPPAEAEARWRTGKLPAMLEGRDGAYRLRVNSYYAAQGAQIDAMLQQGYLMVQARRLGAGELQRIPVVRSSPGGRREGPYAAFLLPGLLGLNLLMMGVFSTGMVDVTLREKGGYKRLATTPLPRALYLAAQITARLIIAIAAAVALMLAGALAFGVRNQGSDLSILALMLLGSACFISMGYVLGSLARTVEAYNGVANLVFLPLMLLSGVYFSLDAAPGWLQKAADFLPLTPLLKAFRAVFNDGASLMSQGPAIALVGAWTVVLFLLAVKRFRWV